MKRVDNRRGRYPEIPYDDGEPTQPSRLARALLIGGALAVIIWVVIGVVLSALGVW